MAPQMDGLPWGKVPGSVLRQGGGLRGRQCRGPIRWRRDWAAIDDVHLFRLKHIIVSDWVGGVDQVPRRPFAVDFNAEGGLNMNTDLPQMGRDNNLLLAAPHGRIKRLGKKCRVTVF